MLAMERSVRRELDRLAVIVVQSAPQCILHDVLRVDPTDISQVRKVVVKYHPFARGSPRGADPEFPDEDEWGAVETAAYYTAICGRPFHAYDILSDWDPTTRICYGPEGFRQYQSQLRTLVWAFCGQPGRLESKGFFESLTFLLSESAKEELRKFGSLDPADELDVILDSLQAKVVTKSEEVESRWGGIPQMKLAAGPLPEHAVGAFWRRVFTTFRGAFVINPPTDMRLGYRELKKLAQERRERVHLPTHPIPQQRGRRAIRYEKVVKKTAALFNEGLVPKQISLRMHVPERTVYYRLKTARGRGLLKP